MCRIPLHACAMTDDDKEETVQITLRVPKSWLADADKLASWNAKPGMQVTRTDAFRMAIGCGLEMMREDLRYIHGDNPKRDTDGTVRHTAADILADDAKPLKTLGGWEFLPNISVMFRPRRYDIDLDRVTDSASLLDAIIHVSQKAWLSSADVGHFVRLVDGLLCPQEYVCSFGEDSTIKPREVLAQTGAIEAPPRKPKRTKR